MSDRTELLSSLKALESNLSEQVRQAEETREQIQQIKAQLAVSAKMEAAPSREGPSTAAEGVL